MYYTSGFVDDVMFSHDGPYGTGITSKCSNSPGGSTRPDVYDFLVVAVPLLLLWPLLLPFVSDHSFSLPFYTVVQKKPDPYYVFK